MAQESLVESDIRAGREFVEQLREKGVAVEGAFWLYLPDLERWKLLIASRDAQSGSHSLYRKAVETASPLEPSSVQFVTPNSTLYRALTNLARHRPVGDAVRISQSMVNGVYVDDALIYRLAA